jgi:hypothetical protein
MGMFRDLIQNKVPINGGEIPDSVSYNSNGNVTITTNMNMEQHQRNSTNQLSQDNCLINQLREICTTNRGAGISTWIIKSAIVNPHCVIVSKDERCSNDLKDTFFSLINTDIYRDLYVMNGCQVPIFTTISRLSSVRGTIQTLPIIFDNSCFF